MSILQRSIQRHMLRRPGQTGLAILGIAVAVAVVVGIDLANTSARRAFSLSVEGVAGRATHEIAGGPRGLDEALYARLRAEQGVRTMAPVVEGWASLSTADGRRALRVLGVDPFAEDLFRSFTRGLRAARRDEAGSASGADLASFLTLPGAVLLSSDLADELGRKTGDLLEVRIGGESRSLRIVGVITPDEPLARETSRDLLIADLATAQESLGLTGRLSRIDLLLDPDHPAAQDTAERLSAWLPDGVELAAKSARSGTLEQMTRAFRLNLRALSMLALVVGMFLIYNTMTFSVVERRRLLGTLRALGVTRREVFGLVLGEAALLGAIGSLFGLALGVALAQGLVGLVTQTINDLYFALNVRGVYLNAMGLTKGLALGLGGTLAAALPAAREATTTLPRAALQRSALEARAHRTAPRLLALGLVLLVSAAALLALPSQGLIAAFSGVFLVLLGSACMVPTATLIAMAAARPLLGRGLGILGLLAARGVSAALSRTGVAMAALVVAVAMVVGVTVMVRSFRTTLVSWLETTLAADIYVAPIDMGRHEALGALPPDLVERLEHVDGVGGVTTSRRVEVDGAHLQILGIEEPERFGFPFAEGDRSDAWNRFRDSHILVSEAFAFHRGLDLGDSVELATDHGRQAFPIAGIVYDYVTDRGVVFVHRAVYDRHWDDRAIQSLGLWTSPGTSTSALLERLRSAAGDVPLTLEPNREIRRAALEIFDRTFVITGVLRLLAVGVAFLGVLSALQALQLERARELGVLRANGMTPGQVWALVTAQTGLMGIVAGILALPLGMVLAALLIHVINRRSFGWTLQMDVTPGVLVQAVCLAVAAALLAGLYPAWKMARSQPAWALREE